MVGLGLGPPQCPGKTPGAVGFRNGAPWRRQNGGSINVEMQPMRQDRGRRGGG